MEWSQDVAQELGIPKLYRPIQGDREGDGKDRGETEVMGRKEREAGRWVGSSGEQPVALTTHGSQRC